MKNLILNFPSNLRDATGIAKKNPLKGNYEDIKNILICGLGGSGIGGKMVGEWFKHELNIPINYCQTYDIPNYVDKYTLVIGSSYSGNTEETLTALSLAKEKSAKILGVCSGGKLAEFCEENGYEFIAVPGGNPPRTQLAFSLVQLTHFFVEIGLIKNQLSAFEEAADILDKESSVIHQKAKELASFVNGKELVIYIEDSLESVAIRARQQFNENSKILCSHHVIPEMNHNELVGWAGGNQNHAVLFIRSANEHSQNRKRFEFSKERISDITSNIFEISSSIDNAIISSLYLINIIDWASFYLAELRNVNAVEVEVITKLKNSLI